MFLGPIVRLLVTDNSLNGDMAAHIMAAVLNALTLHGQHEANQGSLLTLGAQMYELLRPSFNEVLAVMQQIPGVNPVDLQKLDERISGNTSKGNKVEKVKKDLFKKITGTVSLLYLRCLYFLKLVFFVVDWKECGAVIQERSKNPGFA